MNLFIFRKIPQTAKRKKITENVKYFTKSIIRVSFLKAKSISSQAHTDYLANQYCYALLQTLRDQLLAKQIGFSI
jgi:hypothetical protein